MILSWHGAILYGIHDQLECRLAGMVAVLHATVVGISMDLHGTVDVENRQQLLP